jgi:hypothetical protein
MSDTHQRHHAAAGPKLRAALAWLAGPGLVGATVAAAALTGVALLGASLAQAAVDPRTTLAVGLVVLWTATTVLSATARLHPDEGRVVVPVETSAGSGDPAAAPGPGVPGAAAKTAGGPHPAGNGWPAALPLRPAGRTIVLSGGAR